jgi:chromosome partitioning protein
MSPESFPVVSRVFCVANQKGGVGKTTTAVNLADALAKAGRRTLLVDLDPQCNATSGLGREPVEHHPLLNRRPIHENVLETENALLQVLPGSRSFQDIDRLAGDERSSDILQQHITGGAGGYDFVLIDCPPSLGTLTRAALTASTEILMPIQCE